MSRTLRLSRAAAQERTKAALRATVPVAAGGPGSERVADACGVAATAVREWLADEARRHAPLHSLVQVDAATFRRLVAELEAIRAAVYGEEPAPPTRESAALVSVGTSAAVASAVAASLADDGVIDEAEAHALRPLVHKDTAANTRLLAKLAGGAS